MLKGLETKVTSVDKYSCALRKKRKKICRLTSIVEVQVPRLLNTLGEKSPTGWGSRVRNAEAEQHAEDAGVEEEKQEEAKIPRWRCSWWGRRPRARGWRFGWRLGSLELAILTGGRLEISEYDPVKGG